MSILRAEAKTALSPEQAAQKKSLIFGKLIPDEDGAANIIGPDGKTVISKVHPDAKEIDLHQVNELLKVLRGNFRTLAEGTVGVKPRGRDVKRVIVALESFRKDMLEGVNRLDILEGIEAVENAARINSDTFFRGVVGTFLTRGPGGAGFRMEGRDVARRIIDTNDRVAAQELASTLKGHPTAMQSIRAELLADYKDAVVNAKTGTIDLVLHDKWMSRHNEVLEVFFPGTSIGQLDLLGGLAREVSKQGKRTARFEKFIQESFSGRVASGNPRDLTNAFFSGQLSVRDVRKYVRFTRNSYPEAHEALQQSVADEIFRRAGGMKGIINENALDNIIARSGGQLVELYGPAYLSAMNLLSNSIKLIRQRVPAFNRPARGLWNALSRAAYAPPMTREGRLLTAAQSAQSRVAARTMLNALRDPEALVRLANMRFIRSRRTTVLATLASLGGLSFATDEVLEQVATPE